MSLLSLYVLRRIAAPLVLTLGIVLFALVLERLLEISQVVSDHGASAGRAAELIAYLLPHYLGLALPAAAFLGVLFGFWRLQQDRELQVIHAAGVPFRRLLRPVLGLGLLLGALVALNASFAQPHARYAYRATLHQLVGAPLGARIQPGVFHELGEGLVLRADALTRGGRALSGVFAAREQETERTFVVAETGTVVLAPDSRDLVLELQHGTLIRERHGAPAQRIDFDAYRFALPIAAPGAYGPRGRDERERTLPELWAPDAADSPDDITEQQRIAELHARLIAPVSVPLLALLAAPLAVIAGAGRSARLTRFAVAIALLVLYQKLLTVGESLVEQGAAAALPAQWGVVAAFAALAALLIQVANGGAIRGPAAWRRPGAKPADAGAS